MTEPGPHAAHGVLGDQLGRRAAGDQSGRDDRVGLGRVAGDELLLARVLVLRERDGVAADSLRALDVELEERGAEALHLLLDDGAHVEGRHDGPEAPGGRDRLQPRDACAEHEHLRAAGSSPRRS